MVEVFYISNPSRAHKLLPLLEGRPVTALKGWRDLRLLKRSRNRKVVVMIDSLGRFGIIGFTASLLLRAPLIIRLRGEFFREEHERFKARSGSLRWVRYWGSVLVAKFCLWQAAMVIFNSKYLAQTMAPYTRGKISGVVHNPYTPLDLMRNDEGTCELPKNGFHLLTVTNMNLHSKVQPIAEAITDWMTPGLWEELDIHWVICGTGYDEKWLRRLVAEKKLARRVHVVGRVRNTSGLYAWSDIVVHLTKMDAFPNVPMEAMMSGKPVIVNEDSCGTREQVFDGVNGFVVKDAETFTEALHTYSRDRELRERHARIGKALIEEKFSVRVQRREMHEMLTRLENVRDW